MTKYRGFRAVLKRNTTGSTYVTVGQVLEIGDVGSERAEVDVTAYGDAWADFLGGVQTGTEFTIRVAFDPNDTQHAAIKADYDAGTTKTFQLQQPDITPNTTAALQFPALLKGFLNRSPMDGAWEAEITMRIVNPGVSFVTPS